jgi:cytochrome P450
MKHCTRLVAMAHSSVPDWLPSFQLSQAPPGFVDDPYPFYDGLRTHAPVHHLAADAVLLTRYADVLAVYRSAHTSSDKVAEFAPRLGAGSLIFEHHTTSLVFNDPPSHTRVRRLLMGALNQRAIARMEAGVQRLVERLLDRMAGLPEVDLIEDFAACIPVEVIGNLLAVPQAERGPLRDWSQDILWALEPAPTPEVLARANAAVAAFTAYLRKLVAQRRQAPGDPEEDVLTRLLQGDAQGELSEAELLHNCIFLLNAGHETTANLIGNGLHSLFAHPAQLALLIQQPALIANAVEELLRFESPLQLNNRRATASLQLSALELPAGTFITLCIGAANRDPDAFAQPQLLDITRTPNRHLAFGQGAHACSGMNVARLEARVAIHMLLARYPHLQVAGPVQRDRRLRFRGLRHLPVRLGQPA